MGLISLRGFSLQDDPVRREVDAEAPLQPFFSATINRAACSCAESSIVAELEASLGAPA